MLLDWTILYRELLRQQRRQRADAFADPLDSAEWEGLGWLLKLIETSARIRQNGWSAADRRQTAYRPARGALGCQPKVQDGCAARQL